MSQQDPPAFEIIKRSPSLQASSRPEIPLGEYQPAKRCPNCQSVFLTDSSCEACGRSLFFHPIGEPFGAKSFYAIKERYIASLGPFLGYFPFFENQKSAGAKSYSRHLNKRFDHLLSAFGSLETMGMDKRGFFYAEILELMDELLRYGTPSILIEQKIEEHFASIGQLLAQELLIHVGESQTRNHLGEGWRREIFSYRFFGCIRIESALKVGLITATILFMAVLYYDFFSSLVGR
jgi:uncharacterized C2H2 Zn-finger protein